MSCEAYKAIRFTRSTREMLATVNKIGAEYIAAGYVLTVRQMYYQLVARDVVPNTMKSYKRVASIINDGRLAGVVDWDLIEDRTRSFVRRSRWTSAQQILEASANSYHIDMWENQDVRPFVIIEKEALVGILERTCWQNDTPILAARGYPSASVLRDFVQRDVLPNLRAQEIVVIHCGDHDPSGIDMTRDLAERVELFTGTSVRVERVALNMDQVEELQPPPNPAKQTDARFASYEEQFGESSWELDALTPDYLNAVVQEQIDGCRDPDLWAKRQKLCEATRRRIQKVAKQFAKGKG